MGTLSHTPAECTQHFSSQRAKFWAAASSREAGPENEAKTGKKALINLICDID